MITTYELNFRFERVAEVTIDDSNPKLKDTLTEMVEFYSDWEHRLEDNDGDYLITFLKDLTLFIVQEARIPSDDEGWCDMDGSYGITVFNFSRYELELDDVSVEVI